MVIKSLIWLSVMTSVVEDINRRAPLQKVKIDRWDPTTWEQENWPNRKKFLTKFPALTPLAFQNRTHPNLYSVFCEIFKRKDLWTSIDCWGVMRGTKNLTFIEGNKESYLAERDDWRWSLRLHWDYNPWQLEEWSTAEHPSLYQGLVALIGCPVAVGGFQTVPCFTNYLPKWTKDNISLKPDDLRGSFKVPPGDPIQQYIQKIPLRKGELVVWDSRQAHSNYPNYSDKMRLYQFLRVLPATEQSEEKDSHAPLRVIEQYKNDTFVPCIPSTFDYLSPLGKKLIGLKKWKINK